MRQWYAGVSLLPACESPMLNFLKFYMFIVVILVNWNCLLWQYFVNKNQQTTNWDHIAPNHWASSVPSKTMPSQGGCQNHRRFWKWLTFYISFEFTSSGSMISSSTLWEDQGFIEGIMPVLPQRYGGAFFDKMTFTPTRKSSFSFSFPLNCQFTTWVIRICPRLLRIWS